MKEGNFKYFILFGDNSFCSMNIIFFMKDIFKCDV